MKAIREVYALPTLLNRVRDGEIDLGFTSAPVEERCRIREAVLTGIPIPAIYIDARERMWKTLGNGGRYLKTLLDFQNSIEYRNLDRKGIRIFEQTQISIYRIEEATEEEMEIAKTLL